MELDFKIFTLNCWGIPFIAKNLQERFEAIGNFLVEKDYDCVCLQEVWTYKQFSQIQSKISKTLPYGHYFFSGSMGSGICIFSKYPIVDVYFHQWAVNGYIHKIHHGDWFGGKGVGLCKLQLDEYLVNVYTAHLHAEYDRDNDEYKAHRVIQAYDTAQFIQFTMGGADLVVLAGDLNTEPGDLAYKLLCTIPSLTDSFLAAGNHDDMKSTTNESKWNSYTPLKLRRMETCGKRIDYILFHPGSRFKVHLNRYEMPLEKRVPDKHFSYSDHEAVASVFHINGDMANDLIDNTIDKISVLEQSRDILNKELCNLKSRKRFYWLCSLFPFFLFLVTIFTDVPSNFAIPYNFLRSFLAIVTVFYVVMATIWNSIETSGVVSSLLSMDIILKTLRTRNHLNS
ncbi:putative neutral sphingomyelinase [Coccinella septempunctata]|uniref:putative neutral sphingomyelinase n=1 Tax=Coccinella septempunctata TaxID=41139 RepID=UPI001D0721F0|nr:putative neutral sphingomyelinase [Coccinella septempunctata]